MPSGPRRYDQIQLANLGQRQIGHQHRRRQPQSLSGLQTEFVGLAIGIDPISESLGKGLGRQPRLAQSPRTLLQQPFQLPQRQIAFRTGQGVDVEAAMQIA